MAYMGFDKLKSRLASGGNVANPGGLAASIGRKKYGAERFQKAATTGQSMQGLKPLRKAL